MVEIKLAEKSDFDFFYKLKSEESNVFWTGGEDKPKKDNLKAFFDKAVEHADILQERKIYIIYNEIKEKVGHLYIIPNEEEYDLACAVSQNYWGRGYAKQAICLGLQEGKRLGFKRMVGSIREDNIASLKAYKSCGIEVLNEYINVYIPKLNKKVKMYKVIYSHDD